MHPRAEPEGAPEQGSKPRAQRGGLSPAALTVPAKQVLRRGGVTRAARGVGGLAVRKGGLAFFVAC